MESWRLVWREGFAPVLATECLLALRDALRSNDPRLIQGSTSTPPPLMCLQGWPAEAGDFLAYAGSALFGGLSCTRAEFEAALGRGAPPRSNPGAATVDQLEEFFARCCFEADMRLGEPAACRWMLNWWDDTPRDRVFPELLVEVELELVRRASPIAA